MATGSSVLPQLIEATGPFAGRVHELPYGEHIIGRSSGASIVIDHKDISRHHAKLQVRPDGIVVSDLGSKNGIFALGHRIVEPVLLKHGQSFSFGDLTFTVRHAAAQVDRALAQAGEATMTATRTADEEQPRSKSLLWPVVGVLAFGGLVAAMLLLA